MRKDWRKNLGKIVGGSYKLFLERCNACDSVRAFYAPGECMADVNRSFDSLLIQYWDEVEREWGVSINEVKNEFKRRVKYNNRMAELASISFS